MRAQRSAAAIADASIGTILARVDIAAAPERVFRALTTSELVKWWGHDDYRTTKFEITLAPGGRWRSDGVGRNGPFHVGGEVLEVDAPKKLVYTWEPSWQPGEKTKVTYTLDAIDGGTRVTVCHSGFATAASCQNHTNGWPRVLDLLGKHCEPAADPRYFLLRLIPPRATFAQDMSADERAVMTAHGVYWREQLAAGTAIAFGPVLDPAGAWGLGLVRARDEAEVRAFAGKDPALTSNIGMRYELVPMATLVA
ncbi:MAG TPA: SRPBCC domain-containing protein [Kofleriaceae bacterium]|nr:SRPBCC domain-containing protein [Kofleriaceae bacterium]